MRVRWIVSGLVAAASLAAVATASPPPWRPEGGVPLPSSAHSLELVVHDAPIHFAPAPSSKRRGSAQLAARLPVLGWVGPNGSCTGRWFLVGPEAWLCEQHARLSSWPPGSPSKQSSAAGLPYDYNFVGADGSFGYASLSLAEEGIPDSQLEPGFAVALRSVERKPGGELYGLTTHGLWIPMRDLRPAGGSAFQGAMLREDSLAVGWTFRPRTPIYSKPNYRVPSQTLDKLTRVDVLEHLEKWGRRWVRIGEQRWLRREDLRIPTARRTPDELRDGERWLQIDTENQTLIAFEGDVPVFATLVSTGKGTAGSEQATPAGQHRIWVKLVSTDMTNLEDLDASRYYAIEEVPWVMFFERGYGLHGAFWHDDFGNRRSHGCVNLSPKDAQFVFGWAGPELPDGWHASHPTAYDPGTIVVVH